MRSWLNRINNKEREMLRQYVGKNWHEMNACDVVRKLLAAIESNEKDIRERTQA